MRFVLSLIIAFGVSLAVAGLCSFTFGLAMKEPITVCTSFHGLGWINGQWWPGQYCFLGAVLASVGSGFLTLGGLNWK